MAQGDALIRVVQRIDPDTLDDDTWSQRVQESLYVLDLITKNIGKGISHLFSN